MMSSKVQRHPDYPYLECEGEFPCTDCGVYATTRGSMGETNCFKCYSEELLDWDGKPECEMDPDFLARINCLRALLINVGSLPTRGRWAIVQADRASSCKKHYNIPFLSVGDSEGCEDCDKWYAEQLEILEKYKYHFEDLEESDDSDLEGDWKPQCTGHYYDTQCPVCNAESDDNSDDALSEYPRTPPSANHYSHPDCKWCYGKYTGSQQPCANHCCWHPDCPVCNAK